MIKVFLCFYEAAHHTEFYKVLAVSRFTGSGGQNILVVQREQIEAVMVTITLMMMMMVSGKLQNFNNFFGAQYLSSIRAKKTIKVFLVFV